MGFADILAAQRRLDLLRLLAEAPGYESSEWVLYQALAAGPLRASAAAIASDLDFLAEAGLVALRPVEGVRLARATQRGLDVAAGRARAQGVARPAPGE